MKPFLQELGKKKLNRVSNASAVAEEPNEKVPNEKEPPSNKKGKPKTIVL